MSNELVPYSDVEKMATAIAGSKLFGINDKTQALALCLVAQCEGLHPAAAARDYHIIDGKPSLKADAMLARFQASGGKVEWKEYTDTKVVGVFTHPQGGSVSIEWNIDKAKRAEVYKEKTSTNKTGMWVKYPRQMLKARVISEGIRATFPGIQSGMYTPEEVMDFDDKTPRVVTETTATVVSSTPPPATVDPKQAARDAMLADLPVMQPTKPAAPAEPAFVLTDAHKAEITSARETQGITGDALKAWRIAQYGPAWTQLVFDDIIRTLANDPTAIVENRQALPF
jgi:hypothetical protein